MGEEINAYIKFLVLQYYWLSPIQCFQIVNHLLLMGCEINLVGHNQEF